MNIKTNQTLSIFLSLFGILGTLATGYMSAKLTPKAMKKLEELRKDGKILNRWDVFRHIAPVYIPAIIIGVATMASTASSTIISRKTEASLATMALVADQGWRKYKGKVKSMFGMDADSDILKSLAKDESISIKKDYAKTENGLRLYWFDQIGFFWALPENIQSAYADINQRLQVVDHDKKIMYACTLQDFFNGVCPDFVESSERAQEYRDTMMIWGWDRSNLLETYGYAWVHMVLEETKSLETDDESYTVISFIEDPIVNPEGYLEDFAFKSDDEDVRSEYLPVTTLVLKKKKG